MKYDVEKLNQIFNNRTHMPFIMSGENKFFFCQFVNDRWKLSWWDGIQDVPHRIETFVSDQKDTYECSPVCVKIGNNYHISFVTAGPVPGFETYKTMLWSSCSDNIDVLKNKQIVQIGAQTGFVYPNKAIVYSFSDCFIDFADVKNNKSYKYKLILNSGSALSSYNIARITYINDDPYALLISIVRHSDRYCKTIYFNIQTKEQYCVKAGDDKIDVYKCYIDLQENILYHTLRIGTGHECRKIVSTNKIYYEPIIAFKQIN